MGADRVTGDASHLQSESTPLSALIRTRRFRAMHRYGRREWSEGKNREIFGAQTASHEHDFRIEVRVSGPLDPETGFLMDLRVLDGVLDEVLLPLEGSDLNEVIPEVLRGEMQPSTEALGRWIWDRLKGQIPGPAELDEVRVWESDELGSATRRPSPPAG